MEVARRRNTVTFELKDKVFSLHIDEVIELYKELDKIITKEEKTNGSRQGKVVE